MVVVMVSLWLLFVYFCRTQVFLWLRETDWGYEACFLLVLWPVNSNMIVSVSYDDTFGSISIYCYLSEVFFLGFWDFGIKHILAVESFRSLERNTAGQPENVVSLAKWRMLNRLHDRNETLYYRVSVWLLLSFYIYLSHGTCLLIHNSSSLQVLIDNIKDFAPIIYTPTVGLVCQNYSGLYRRPRGMYFSAKDKGEMMSMIYNWPAQQVDMIVITDGSRILGLGDLGVQGIGIPIGKLDMYVAAAGINPQRVCGSQHDRVFFFFFCCT